MSKILITSGPTRQYLDPVRFLSNASSGRMGCAIAAAAVPDRAPILLPYTSSGEDTASGGAFPEQPAVNIKTAISAAVILLIDARP